MPSASECRSLNRSGADMGRIGVFFFGESVQGLFSPVERNARKAVREQRHRRREPTETAHEG